MSLLTVVVSYNRLELLKQTVESYHDTVTLPGRMIIVDNASDPETRRYLRTLKRGTATVVMLDSNRYPGFATNYGWAVGISKEIKTRPYHLLHRSDNDVEYLVGWCDEVTRMFDAHERLGQLGLRTVEEEGDVGNVGGNCVIRRELWDLGARYSEEPWTSMPFEDGMMSGRVQTMGYTFARAEVPCIVHTGIANRDDPYYQQTFSDRRIDFATYGL